MEYFRDERVMKGVSISTPKPEISAKIEKNKSIALQAAMIHEHLIFFSKPPPPGIFFPVFNTVVF